MMWDIAVCLVTAFFIIIYF